MDKTSVNLLKRLKEPDSDSAWSRFVELYTPLMFYWSRQHGLNGTDAADLVQEILTLLVTKLASFEYDASQRFRGWLHTVTLNKARDWNRRQSLRPNTDQSSFFEHVAENSRSDAFEEREYRAFLVDRAKQLLLRNLNQSLGPPAGCMLPRINRPQTSPENWEFLPMLFESPSAVC